MSQIDVPLRPFAHFSLISSSLCDGMAQPVVACFVVGSPFGSESGHSAWEVRKSRFFSIAFIGDLEFDFFISLCFTVNNRRRGALA